VSSKRILSYAALTVSLFLLFRISYLLLHRNAPAAPEEGTGTADFDPSRYPMTYSLGSFDPRFGITQERFLQLVDEAKGVWEKAAGRQLFTYGEDAPMRINLVFDERQERLLEAKDRKAKLDEGGRSFDLLESDYGEKFRSLQRLRDKFEESAQEYQSNLDIYNARVNRWNEGTSHAEAERQDLEKGKKELENEQNELDRKRVELNNAGQEYNALGERINALAKKYNLEVEDFNGTFIRARDFEKGVFDGKSINIFEFENEGDLDLALVHEFGHALGLGHIENPKAIMNRKLSVQDVNNIQLTTDDVNLLMSKLKR
jgi:hypothetical protein